MTAEAAVASAKQPLSSNEESLIVMMPCYNDWEVLGLLLRELDEELARQSERASVMVVDDGSTNPGDLSNLAFRSISELSVLRLRRNVGHQRAITIGLAYIAESLVSDLVVVMDCDGEDQPSDALELVRRCRQEQKHGAVFALRQRRSEGPLFRLFYTLYRHTFHVLTGQTIRVGNFSVLPRATLRRLVACSELWNHYAAGAQRARVPCVYVPTSRGRRLAGRSTMNFVSLITHGLSAMSVYADVIGSRMLVLAGLFVAIIVLALFVVVGIRVFTELAIPGWASFVFGILCHLLLQAVMIAFFFAGTILHGRNASTFLPSRDHVHFVDRLEIITKRHAG
jgi:glycosyltransferase involved in cell wall biosynthesis